MLMFCLLLPTAGSVLLSKMAVAVIFLVCLASSLSFGCKTSSTPREIDPPFVCSESSDSDLGELTRGEDETEILKFVYIS